MDPMDLYSRPMHRCYAPGLEAGDETVALEEDEASHIVRVLRLAPGADVHVFNGRGVERRARVELADKRGVVLRITAPVVPAPELPFALTLAQAALKGDGMDEVVRDAVMLGVTRIVPLVTSHVEVSRAHIERTSRVERWARVAVSSAKQCGRAVVPPVDPPSALAAVFERIDGLACVLVEPRVASDGVRIHDVPPGAPSPGATLFVGPEG
jgi:16S rRNA (uracil1498-N3)-methyltransferase